MVTYIGKRVAAGAVVFRAGENRVLQALPTRLDRRNHSPTGFEWGYNGSGPAQLALALLADATGDDACGTTAGSPAATGRSAGRGATASGCANRPAARNTSSDCCARRRTAIPCGTAAAGTTTNWCAPNRVGGSATEPAGLSGGPAIRKSTKPFLAWYSNWILQCCAARETRGMCDS